MPKLFIREYYYSQSYLCRTSFVPLSYLFHTSFSTNSKQIRNKYVTNSNMHVFVTYLLRICFEFVLKEV